MNRTAWHLRAGSVVLLWLVALVVIVCVHPFVATATWLMVHLLLLGAVSNAILIWSWHFAAALLKLPAERMDAGRAPRLVAHNVGALAVVAGIVLDRWPLVAAGGALVALVAGWHALALWRRMRQALPSRFGHTVLYYVAAGGSLLLGVVGGIVLSGAALTDAAYARLKVAHTVLNLFGWVGLTVLGTLVTLWPTMLRTRMTAGSEDVARRVLPALLIALAVAAGGAAAGIMLVTAAGIGLYAAAVVVLLVPHVEEVRRKTPTTFGTTSVLAAAVWFVVALVWFAGGVAVAGSWSDAGSLLDTVAAPLLVGFAAQVLLGALTYLVPVVLGGGPNAVRGTTAVLEKGGPARVVMVNAGLLLCLLPVPSVVRVIASLVVVGAYAAFVPLLVRAVLHARRVAAAREAATVPAEAAAGGARRGAAPGGAGSDGAPSDGAVPDGAAPKGQRRNGSVPVTERVPDGIPAARRLGMAATGLAVVVLAAAVGVAVDPAAAGLPGAVTASADVQETGRTTTVEVTVDGMRFVPASIQVPAGDRLVIEFTNTGTDRHDLVLETGARTPRLAPGEHTTLDVGVVGRTLDGWCSVAGHKQMGMVFTVEAVGGADRPADPASATGDHDHHAADGPSAADDVDLAAAPDDAFVPYDPVLPPASEETVHRHTLTVQEAEAEVSPGVTQTLWTFNGTAPGPTLRGRVGDVFEITLVNDGTIGHSIDFHAGALAPDEPMRTIQPGEELTYRFTATRAGIWMYHCSTMPMSLHIANGMFGAVVIDPPDLAPVDHEYVLVQSELYLGPQGGVADADRILTADPDLVVFNGYANQYAHRPLTARVGERVRVWVLAAGPTHGTAFHVVGGQFDTVWSEGAYRLRPDGTHGGSQVLGLFPAEGGFVELDFPEAGTYPFVNHAMVYAERGAHGLVTVTD